jgi:hypothetical protein
MPARCFQSQNQFNNKNTQKRLYHFGPTSCGGGGGWEGPQRMRNKQGFHKNANSLHIALLSFIMKHNQQEIR